MTDYEAWRILYRRHCIDNCYHSEDDTCLKENCSYYMALTALNARNYPNCEPSRITDLQMRAEQTENSSEKPNNSTISKMEQFDKDINVRSKDEQTDCTEALTLLWIKNMVTDEEFYRIDARLKVMPQTERSE